MIPIITQMIVITGLDGSGKSTFLRELETKLGSQIAVLRLPSMEPEKFQEVPTLFTCCKMINELGKRGDKEAEPGMKIIALFSSVVLFNNLLKHLKKQQVQVVFCERHPLVDTLIYAKAYLKVMHPSILSLEKAAIIDTEYELLLTEVTKKLKVDFSVSTSLKSHSLLAFLHDWFSKEENLLPEKLVDLFEVEKLDEIYFLDAPAPVLFKRIENRENMEYHENVASLEKMRSYYHALLPKFGSQFEVIDATKKIGTDALLKRLTGRFL